MIELQVKYVNKEVEKRAPLRHSLPGDAGFDLYNASDKYIEIAPGISKEVFAGIQLKIPDGYCGLVRSRSSTFYRRGLFVIEGLIDCGYTGPVFTLVWNPALNGKNHSAFINSWERLGQLLIVPVPEVQVKSVEELPKTARGEKGFGSTGY